MKDYIICTDVSCDVDLNFAKENNIVFIPMEYSLGDITYKCSGTNTNEEIRKFYLAQRKGIETKTTQITPYLYEEFFSTFLEQGISILYLSLSSGLSNTYNSALLAASNLELDYPNSKVVVVDSLSATGVMGLIIERMVENKKKGLDILANKEDIDAYKLRYDAEFMVKDLMYLKRGGRVSALSAAVGTVLDIRPILIINDQGKLVNIEKKRGDNGSLRFLIERFKANYTFLNKRIYIGGSDSDELQANLKEMILEIVPDAIIIEKMLSPIIGAHTGPGMVFMVYERKSDRDHV